MNTKHTPTWETPKTTKVYLHSIGSQRLVMLHPDFKITDIDLIDKPMHFNQKGFGVHLLFTEADGKMGECEWHNTEWVKPAGGIPVYTVCNRGAYDGCTIEMTAFSDTDRIPVTYCELVITNANNYRVSSNAGVMPRYADIDHYITGLHDTGYEPYSPNWRQWLLCRSNRFSPCDDGITAKASNGYGSIRLLELTNCSAEWIDSEAQPNRFEAWDYYRISYTLEAGECAVVRFAIRRGGFDESIKAYDDALIDTCNFWSDIQGEVKLLPDCASDETENIFRHNITQMLQMLQRYEGGKDPDAIYARQGDVGRYIWIWEAIHWLTLLDRVGLSRFVTPAYRMWFDCWQIKEGDKAGLLNDPYVHWDNANGSALGGLSLHLMTLDSRDVFESFREGMLLALEYVQSRRDPDKASEGEVKGLFTSGQASDWGEIGQHWTYTDAVNCYCIGFMAECFEHFGDEKAAYVRGIYDDYHAVLMGVLRDLSEPHRGERSYLMPHILGKTPEETFNHCFYTDGISYLPILGIMDPNSEIFEQTENAHRDMGFLDDEHGLAARMTNDACGADGLYGNVYYTGVAEFSWIHAWLARGEKDKAAKYLEGTLRYNITPEYISSERYCSTDPWFVPWQPNASGSGRLCHLLLDYYGEKKL